MARAGASIRLTGDEVLIKLLQQAPAKSRMLVGQALMEEAQLIMRKSLQQVPIKDGILKASHTILPPVDTGSLISITMGYGGGAAKYAEYVHNSPYEKNWTKAGTKSHFLSDPMQDASPRIEQTLMKRIGTVMGRSSAAGG